MASFKGFFALLFLFTSTALFGQNSLDQLRKDFSAARYFELEEKLPLAISAAEQNSDWKNYGSASNLLVRVKMAEGKVEEGFELLEAASKKLDGKLGKQEEVMIEQLALSGDLQLAKGRNDLAAERLEEAYKLASENLGNKHLLTAQCANDLGLVYWNNRNLEQAHNLIQAGLDIRMEVAGEKSVEVAASLNNLGLLEAGENPETAIQFYQKAVKIYLQHFEENHPVVANSYNNLALSFLATGDADVAQQYFERVLTIRKSAYGENHPNVAFVLNNIGQAYARQGKENKALEFHQQALEMYRAVYGEKHPEVAQTYNLIGATELVFGEYQLALEAYQKALISNSPDFSKLEISAHPAGESYFNADLQLATLLLKAQALEARHFGKTLRFSDLKLALKTLEAADQLIVQIRQHRFSKKDKIALGKTAAEVYEDAIRLCLYMSTVTLNKKEYWEKAFNFSEKSKSAVLLASITEANAFAGLPDQLLQQEKALKAEIGFTEQKLAQAETDEKRAALRESLLTLKSAYQKLIDQLEKDYPAYFNLKFKISTSEVAEIQQLLPEGTAMISYFLPTKDQRLYAFVLTGNKLKAYNLPLVDDFQKKIMGMRNAIRFDVAETYSSSSHALYRQLIKGLIPSGTDHLIVLPDGPIGTVPFEALLVEKPEDGKAEDYTAQHYLVQDVAITYHFSGTLYHYLNTHSSKTKETTSEEIFLCAPVEFGSKAFHPVRSGLPTLPATENEIQRIQALFEKEKKPAKVFARGDANEGLIKSGEMENYRYVHLATHGVVDMENPDLSQVFLADDANSQEDGNLYAGEIYNLVLNADLVTLSACETGLGKIARGEGIIGLSRALIYAGARNLIVSLWTVADNSTSELMVDFYEDLLTKNQQKEYQLSLQNAKKKMIADDRFASPYFWAPFILIGR